jgi:hypothetical protein
MSDVYSEFNVHVVSARMSDDIITLEPITITKESHPKSVMIYSNRRSTLNMSERVFDKNVYLTTSLIEIIKHATINYQEPKFPDTRITLTKNILKRIELYNIALELFPEMSYVTMGLDFGKPISDVSTTIPSKILLIINEFFSDPTHTNYKNEFRCFPTYMDIIKYLLNGTLMDRKKSTELLETIPPRTIILRQSSYEKYNNDIEEFFAFSVVNSVDHTVSSVTEITHCVYCHRKGYGYFDASSYINFSFDGSIIFDENIVNNVDYYPSIGEFILNYLNKGYTFYKKIE